jgi:RHH-type transcriptional regulator, rel operon repressor / antitoxin RelB
MGVYNVHIKSIHLNVMTQSETVTVRLSIEVKQKLEALAARTRRSKSWLAAEAISAYVEAQSWQIEQIETAVVLADSDQAVWVEGAAIEDWLSSWGTETERSVPCE